MTPKQWKLVAASVVAMIITGLGVYTDTISIVTAIEVISESLTEIVEVITE